MTLDELTLEPGDAWGHVAIDFETYHDRECTIKELGAWHYLHHPACHIFLVSIFDGEQLFVGSPEEFDWSSIAGRTWVSHNRSFEVAVHERLIEQGVISPGIEPDFWHCTADMAVYLRAARDLKKASRILLNVELAKETRKLMKGLKWEEFDQHFIGPKGRLIRTDQLPLFKGKTFKDNVIEYAADDAKACWWLWAKHSRFWPPNGNEDVIVGHGDVPHLKSSDEEGITFPLDERRLSMMTTEQGHRGFLVDQEKLNFYLSLLRDVKARALERLPWVPRGTEEGALSIKKLNEQCQKIDIEPPITTSEDSSAAREWEQKHVEIKWLKYMRQFRKANILEKRMLTIKNRLKPDGRFPFSMLYGGAHTLRWSGGSSESKGGIGETGFNVQNFNKEPFVINVHFDLIEDREYIDRVLKKDAPDDFLAAIDLRKLVKAPPGKRIAIADLSQIEPRVIRWLLNDQESLEMIGEGYSIYEIHARKTMGWTGGDIKKERPDLQFIAKQRVLSLGYGCGWIKFQGSCANFYVVIPDEEARAIVTDFREKEAALCAHWHNHSKNFNTTWAKWVERGMREEDRTHAIRLPNGRKLVYWMHAPDKELVEEKLAKAREQLWKNDPVAAAKREANGQKNSNGNRAAYTSRDFSGKWMWFYGGLLTENEVSAISRDIMAQALINLEDAGHQIVFSVHDEAVLEVAENVTEDEIKKQMCWRLPWAPDLPLAASCVITDFYCK